MIVIEFFIVLFGLFGISFLKHKDKKANERIKRNLQNMNENIQRFQEMYVSNKDQDYELYRQIHDFFLAIYPSKYPKKSEPDPTLAECYEITKQLSAKGSDQGYDLNSAKRTPMFKVSLARKYGKIDEIVFSYGYKKEEYAIANWMKDQFKEYNAPKLCSVRYLGEVIRYIWENSYAYYHTNRDYEIEGL